MEKVQVVQEFKTTRLFKKITANIGEGNNLYFGDGALNFREQIQYDTSKNRSYALAIGDLDLDGDMGIIVGNRNATNTVFLNGGNGKEWLKMELGTNQFSTYDILVEDLNGDGRPDIMAANSDEVNAYYFNFKKE